MLKAGRLNSAEDDGDCLPFSAAQSAMSRKTFASPDFICRNDPMKSQSRSIVTFLGCPVSAQTATLLQHWRQAAAPHLALSSGAPVLRWTHPESLHLTLHYFGPVAQASVTACQSVLGEIVQATPEIPIRLKALALFPRLQTARGLWMEVEDPTGTLKRLQADLVQQIEHLDLPGHRRRFRPHVTVGRMASSLQGPQRQEAANLLQQVAATRSISMPADKIALVLWYQSVPQPGGNLYRPLATWVLNTAAQQRRTGSENPMLA